MSAPYSSIFDLVDYSSANGLWRLHFVARTPPPGADSDIYVDIPESELPSNINQNQLVAALKSRLGWKLNQTFGPLNTFMVAGSTVTLP